MSDLPAGRELDALIAEKVMGLPPEKWHPPCGFYHRTDDAEYDDGQWTGWCYSCGMSIGEVEKQPKRYSRDISAAWEVVEEAIRPKGWALAPIYEGNGAWGVFESEGTRTDLWEEIAQGETAPLAICRAALKV